MTWLVSCSVVVGLAVGRFSGLAAWTRTAGEGLFERLTTAALCVLLVCVGIEIGRPGDHWRQLRRLGARCLLLPAAIVVGSLGGCLLASFPLRVPAGEALTVGAGVGWYSLSGVLVAKLHSPALGALAFLTNLMRELLAFLLVPTLAARLGVLAAIAPCGATAMDTTLPLVQRVAGPTAAVLAFLSGLTLSLVVPILVPALARLCR